MNAIDGDPVLADLARYLAQLDTEDKKDAFLESIPWSEIIDLAGMDVDDILADYHAGRKAQADRALETAKGKALAAVQEQELKEVESRWDRYEERSH